MRKNAKETLEFNIILEHLSNFANSEKTKEKLLTIKAFLSESECKAKMNEVTEAYKILESLGTSPISPMKEFEKILDLAKKGAMLQSEQLNDVASFIYSCKRMNSYLKRAQFLDVGIAYYGSAFNDLKTLFEEIDNANASVKLKLESILRSKKEWFVDGYVSICNGKFVLPVKKRV